MAFTLNNTVTLPDLGYGVFQTPPEETTTAVVEALKVGYRHVDTAAIYFNEAGVGAAIKESGLARDELFIETKLWISDFGHEAALHGFEKSAAKLGLEQIDLLLLHQPLTAQFDLTLDAYRALEELYAAGKVRAIGVSNFMIEDLERLLAVAEVVPAVNQIEVHPYFQQRELQTYHAERGILTQAWSPIGGVTVYRDGIPSVMENPVLTSIAAAHGKSLAQVMLRWHLQEGRSAIPKSVKPARMAENFDIFDFELSAAELAAIDALDTGVRGGPEPAAVTLENFGMPIPEA